MPENTLVLTGVVGSFFNNALAPSDVILKDKILRNLYVNYLLIENKDTFNKLLKEDFNLGLYINNPSQYWNENFKEKFGDEPGFLRDVYLKDEISQEKLNAFLGTYK